MSVYVCVWDGGGTSGVAKGENYLCYSGPNVPHHRGTTEYGKEVPLLTAHKKRKDGTKQQSTGEGEIEDQGLRVGGGPDGRGGG